MRIKTYQMVLLSLALALVSSCDLHRVGGEGDIYPANAGNTWVYYDEVSERGRTFTMFAPVQHDGGFQVYPINIESDGYLLQSIYLYQDDAGLYYYYSLQSIPDNRWQLAAFPLVVGSVWEFDYRSTVDFNLYHIFGALEDVENVESEGTIYNDCYRIHFSGDANETLWFCPGVGVVRDIGHSSYGGYILKLESYTLY